MIEITKKKIFDYDIVDTNIEVVKELIFQSFISGNSTFIVTVNPEILHFASKDNNYRDLLKCADALLPDGIGIIIAGKILGKNLKERITGIDLVEKIFSDGRSFSLYLLGAKPNVVEKLNNIIVKKYPHIKVVGFHHGYFSEEEEDSILREIKKLQPDLLLVGMGFPKQDYIAFKAVRNGCAKVAFGVGGTFDVLSGEKKRAPRLMRKIGLEWFWRLVNEPWRIKRIFALPAFVVEIISYKIKKGG